MSPRSDPSLRVQAEEITEVGDSDPVEVVVTEITEVGDSDLEEVVVIGTMEVGGSDPVEVELTATGGRRTTGWSPIDSDMRIRRSVNQISESHYHCCHEWAWRSFSDNSY